MQFLYVLFLYVAYINKSIYIYIYELAVEFCIFESSIMILKKNLPDGFIPRFVPGPHNLQIKQCSAYNIC